MARYHRYGRLVIETIAPPVVRPLTPESTIGGGTGELRSPLGRRAALMEGSPDGPVPHPPHRAHHRSGSPARPRHGTAGRLAAPHHRRGGPGDGAARLGR